MRRRALMIVVGVALAVGGLPLPAAGARQAEPASPPSDSEPQRVDEIDFPWHRPPSEADAAGIVGKRPGVSELGGEVVGLRDEFSKTFELVGRPGVFRTEVSLSPVHVQAADGSWAEVDTSLSAETARGGREVARSPHPVSVAGTAGGAVLGEIELEPSVSVGFGLEGAEERAGRFEDHRVVYAGVFDGVDVHLEPTATALKETLVLAGRESPRVFRFPLSLSDGLVPRVDDKSGAVEFFRADGTGEAGEVLGVVPAGWMQDADIDERSLEAAVSDGVAYSLEGDAKAGFTLVVSLDDAWLDAPERVFPVRVDPTIDVFGDDTYVRSNSSSSFVSSSDLLVGTWDSGATKYRSVMHVGLPEGLSGRMITDADLQVYNYHSWSCSSPRQLRVYRATQDWFGTKVVWPGPSVSSGYHQASFARDDDCGTGGYASIDITSTFHDWAASGGALNRGLVLRAGSETNNFYWKRFYSADTFVPPRVSFTWTSSTPPVECRAGDCVNYGTATDASFERVDHNVAGAYGPVAGDFDGDGAADQFWYSAWYSASSTDYVWWGDQARHNLGKAGFTQTENIGDGTHTARLAGDFDGDGYDDIFFYAPYSPTGAADVVWWGGPNRGAYPAAVSAKQVSGLYSPFTGDFDGDGRDDIFWYGPGATTDSIWYGTSRGGFGASQSITINGDYVPVVGDFDADGDDDIFWYAPGAATDYMWPGTPTRAALGVTSLSSLAINGWYRPAAGDFDGDGHDDIIWAATGTAPDFLWAFSGITTQTSHQMTITGAWEPTTGDFDADGRDDVFWYAPGNRFNHAPTITGLSPGDGQRVADDAELVRVTATDGGGVGQLRADVSFLGRDGVVVASHSGKTMPGGSVSFGTGDSGLDGLREDVVYSWQARVTDTAGAQSAWSPPRQISFIDAPLEDGAGIGKRDYWDFESFSLSGSDEVKVNIANGNALYVASDVSLAGTGFDAEVGRVYNSQQSGSGPLGSGWQLNDGYGVALGLSDTNGDGNSDRAIWRGSGGERYEFTLLSGTGTAEVWATPAEAPNVMLSELATGEYQLELKESKTYLTFTATGYLSSRRDRNDNKATYTYTPDHFPLAVSDTRGRNITFSDSDDDGLVDEIVAPAASGSRTWSLAYDNDGRLAMVTDPAGFDTRYGYDNDGLLDEITIDTNTSATESMTTLVGYSATTGAEAGEVSSVTRVNDQAGSGSGNAPDDPWIFEYFDANDPECTAAPASFGSDNPCTRVTDPRGNETYSQIDTDDSSTIGMNEDNGKVTAVVDARGNRVDRSYTSSSNIEDLTPAGASDPYRTSYNSDNMADSVTSPTGQKTSVGYTSSDGFLTSSVSNEQGQDQGYGYDGTGNLNSLHAGTLSSQGQQGDTLEKFYDLHRRSNDNTTTVDAGEAHDGRIDQIEATEGGHVTEYVYGDENDETCTRSGVKDPDPDLDCIKHPVLGEESFEHDDLGRLTEFTDGEGNVTANTYDDLDHLAAVSYTPSGSSTVSRTVTFSYDGAGNRVQRVDATGTISYDYDDQNRLVREDRSSTVGADVTYHYDGVGNLVSYTDAGGTVSYAFDEANNTCWAHVGTSTNTCASPPGGETFVMDYDDGNRRERIDFPNGFDSFVDWDDSGKPTVIKHGPEGGGTDGFASLEFHESYDYMAGSTEAQLLQSLTDELTSDVTTFAYSTEQQLETATTGSDVYSYTYDGRGNRLTKSQPGQATTYFAYNGDNQLCWSKQTSNSPGNACGTAPTGKTDYVYDDNGSLTSLDAGGTVNDLAFGYDEADHQCWTAPNAAATGTCGSVPSGSTTYEYAGLGQAERTGVGSTEFTNTALGLSVAGDSADRFWVRLPDGTLLSQRTRSTKYYVHTDRLGSVRLVTNTVGSVVEDREYTPYGELASGPSSPVVPFGFAGQYLDTQTGHYKMGERYYMPTTGTWTQTDPVRGSGQDQRKVNRFIYAGGDPVNMVDTTGFSFWDDAANLVSDLSDADSLADLLDSGDLGEAGEWLASEAVGVVAESTCYAGAIGLGATTGGAGFAAAAVCTGVGVGFSEMAESFYE